MNTLLFLFNSIMMGVGLAMDAFCVSAANGLRCPRMTGKQVLCISSVFAFFQFIMPLIGYICVHTILEYFTAFGRFIPWIALILLFYIGGKLLMEGIHSADNDENNTSGFPTVSELIIQGIATSIDALSVGFTIAGLTIASALLEAGIIAVVTLAICVVGVHLGKAFGTGLKKHANILGGCILIFIGLEIFISSFM